MSEHYQSLVVLLTDEAIVFLVDSEAIIFDEIQAVTLLTVVDIITDVVG